MYETGIGYVLRACGLGAQTMLESKACHLVRLHAQARADTLPHQWAAAHGGDLLVRGVKGRELMQRARGTRQPQQQHASHNRGASGMQLPLAMACSPFVIAVTHMPRSTAAPHHTKYASTMKCFRRAQSNKRSMREGSTRGGAQWASPAARLRQARCS